MEDNNKKASQTLWDALAAIQPMGITQGDLDKAALTIKEDIDTKIINDILAEAIDKDQKEGAWVLSAEDFTNNGDVNVLDSADAITWTYGPMTIAVEPITAITIHNPQGDLVVEIKYTGEVTLGKNVSAQHAAHEFWIRVADHGAHFEKRLEALQNEVDVLEQGFDDEQSMRLELEETFNDICLALGVPSGREDEAVDFAKKFKEEYDNGAKLIRELRGDPKPVETIETAETAYNRAMKVVR